MTGSVEGRAGGSTAPGGRRGFATRLTRAAAGLVLGSFTAAAEMLLLVLAAPAMAWAFASSRGRRAVPRAVAAGAVAAARLEHGRLAACFGHREAAEYGPARALAYLALRVPVGLLGAAVLTLIVYGVVMGVALLVGWWITGDHLDDIPPEPLIVLYIAVSGAILLFIAVQGLVGVVALERRLARRLLGPSPLAEYERRIEQLSVSRAEVVEAVDHERRRIERDLHDGVQQRLVALGMLIGRARRAGDGERARELLRQAHEESGRVLEDLREVTWRVYPAALDGEGLRAALETVAERSPLPVAIDYEPSGRPPHAVETAAYFVVCEAVTNAAKHSGATRVAVRVTATGTTTETETGTGTGTAGGEANGAGRGGIGGGIGVRIEDDGGGGADPAGGGLSGLARRVAALDGTFTVDSPPGGPTVIAAELPCG
ncbi:sensor histidine kinase [Actinomadura viridis]|uniref:sensor histidine kinase n=1 Tax=Actinomadura viridis TaxID=58110 RepID=UPI00367AC793